MDRTIKFAKKYGVAVGAHIGLPDRQGFGRRQMDISVEELRSDMLYQLGAMDAFLKLNGLKMQHVKPHGILYRMVGEQEKYIYETLVTIISKKHIIKEVEKTASKGSYNLESGVISVRSDLEYFQKIKTVLHEYAHSIDFVMHPDSDIKRNIRELIAESTAFVVAEQLGLDTSRYSVSYIRSWMKDRKELKDIADTVQKISYQIINEIAGADLVSKPAVFDLEEESI
jgi:hypothetical protein